MISKGELAALYYQYAKRRVSLLRTTHFHPYPIIVKSLGTRTTLSLASSNSVVSPELGEDILQARLCSRLLFRPLQREQRPSSCPSNLRCLANTQVSFHLLSKFIVWLSHVLANPEESRKCVEIKMEGLAIEVEDTSHLIERAKFQCNGSRIF